MPDSKKSQRLKVFKEANIKYEENIKLNLNNFFKEGIVFVQPKPLKQNQKKIQKLRKDLEKEFQNRSCPREIFLDEFKNEDLKKEIQHFFMNEKVSRFLTSFSQINAQEKVFLFPNIIVMRNYYSGPQVGFHGWHNDCGGEWQYKFCEERLLSGDYIFGKLSVPLQKNGIKGGNIDIAKGTYKEISKDSLRQRISNKLQEEILSKIIKKSPSLPKFLANQWITDLISLITQPRTINPNPLTIVAFSHKIFHRGTPQSPIGWNILKKRFGNLNLENFQIKNIDLKEQNKYMIYVQFGNKVGLESYLYDRSRRDAWDEEYSRWLSQFKYLNLFSNVFKESELLFKEICENLKIDK